MNTLTKSASLGALALPSGDHWVKFHVDGDAISYEVAVSSPQLSHGTKPNKPTNFVQRWGASVRKMEDAGDAWLTRINEKHLR